uniref:Amino acid transporter transmembrane domain-containing protein n=1 Tax=Alexandrium catenella TaxID=2925 RepID=A0A7S1W6I8_ALECA
MEATSGLGGHSKEDNSPKELSPRLYSSEKNSEHGASTPRLHSCENNSQQEPSPRLHSEENSQAVTPRLSSSEVTSPHELVDDACPSMKSTQGPGETPTENSSESSASTRTWSLRGFRCCFFSKAVQVCCCKSGPLQVEPPQDGNKIAAVEGCGARTELAEGVSDFPPHAALSSGGARVIMASGGNGRLVTVFNIANGLLGTGLLVVPNAFRQCGWATALIFLAMAALSSGSAVLIIRCMSRAEARVPPWRRKGGEPVDWPLIGQAALGRPGRLLVQCIWVTGLYLKQVFCLVLNGQNLSILFPRASSSLLVGVSGLAAFGALYVPAKFDECFSFMGIAVTALIAAAVLTSGSQMPERPAASEYQVFDPSPFVTVATTALFCCQMHSAIPSIYLSMKPESKRCFWKVSVLSFGSAFAVYMLVGAAGYFFFAGSTQENVAKNIALDLHMEPIPNLGFLRLVLAALIVVKTQVTFPMFCWPLLHAASAALKSRGCSSRSSPLLLKLSFLVLTTLPAIFLAQQMLAVLSLCSAIVATSTAIIFPTAFYMLLFKDRLKAWHFLLLGALFACGVYLQVTGTARAISRIVQGA